MQPLRHELLTRAAPLALLTRDHAGDLETREAVPRPSSWDATARTIEAVIATDARVARRDQAGEFDEVLDPATLDLASARGVHVLDAHQQGGINTVIGVVEDVRREGNAIVARIRFSERAEVQSIVNDIATGIIRSLSIGYRVSEWRDGQANGRRTRTAARWSIHEVSFVPVPADPAARTRNLSPRPATANREIRALGLRAGASQATIDDLIDRGASLAEATTTFMGDMITRSTPIRTAHHDTTLDNPEVRVLAMGEALYARANPRHQPSGQARPFIGLTIPELARECLSRAGGSTLGLGAGEIITRALNTTSDFPALLGDVVGRTLRQSYSAPPSGIRILARETSASDFRMKSSIMLDSAGLELLKVNEHGEFKSGSMAEGKESYKVDTFGRIFGITRQALVNDDLGAFTDISRRLGQQAVAFEAKFLVDLLIALAGLGPIMNDGKNLFDADHGNLAAIDAPPTEASLTAARLAMRRQTSLAGGIIAINPAFLLVPPELETLAEKLLTAIQPMQTADANPFSKLTLIVEPRLTDPLRWYLIAPPAEVDGLEFARLSGSAQPDIQTRAGFEIDGVETRVRLDFGAGFVDHRGWYSNAGAVGP